MVVHTTEDHAPHGWLTVEGVRKALYVQAEEGKLPIEPSFLDEQVPAQQNDKFSYKSVPPTVLTTVEMPSWELGAGFLDAPPGSLSFSGYGYSRGVDVSDGIRARRAAAPTSLTGITGNVTKFYRSPAFGKWYALAGRRTYSWNTVAETWTELYDTASASVVATDIIEFTNSVDTYLLLAFDEGQDIRYSTDGAAFGSSVAGKVAKFFSVRGVSSAEPQLWKIRANGRISVSTLGISNWSAEDPITPGGDTVTAMVTAGQHLWIFYTSGYRGYDGVTIADMIEVSYLSDPTNGSGAFVAPNGLVYFNLLNRLVAIDPYNFTTTTVWEAVHPELNGHVGAIGASIDTLFFVLNTNRGSCYVMKGGLTGPFHTWGFLSGQNGDALAVAPAGEIHAENPMLLIGYSDAGQFPYDFPIGFGDVRGYILAREGYRPEDDPNYVFEEGSGTLYGSWLDKGALTFLGTLDGGRVITELSAGSRRVTLGYSTDGDETVTSLVVASENGLTTTNLDSATTVQFTRIRHALTLEVSDSLVSPVCIGATFDVTPSPPRFRLWQWPLDLANAVRLPGGGIVNDSYHETLLFLQSAVGRRVLFEDYYGHIWVVKCVNVVPGPVTRASSGQDRKNVKGSATLVLAEIAATTDDGSVFTWGSSYWNGGDIWGAS